MSARTLPLFPLPVVLFPGAVMPLHVFEPRYRRMLADCLAGDRQFGIVYAAETADEELLPQGQVGCVATIASAQTLPDGRSNIAVNGGDRFVFLSYVAAPEPYRIAAIESYEDRAEPLDALAPLADQVRTAFQRAVEAARTLADDRSPSPELPDDPSQLAFRMASLIDVDIETRQRVLASRSPHERLIELARVLAAAVAPLERRAETHRSAKQNGRAGTHGSESPA